MEIRWHMLFDFAILLYLLAFLSAGFNAFLGGERYTKIATAFVSLAAVVNLSYLIARWYQFGVFSIKDLKDIFNLIILFLGVSAVYINYKVKKDGVYLFVIPVIIILGIAGFAHSSILIRRQFSSFWLAIHLPFTISGTVLFVVSALFGILYFIQEKQLKKKNFGYLYNLLPSIDMLNKINKTAMLVGFLLFTIGLLSGYIWGIYEWNGRIILTSKLLFSMITWFIFGIIIVIKKTKGMSPRDTAFSSILGIVSVVVTYIGVALFIKG
ncbi:MAG: hypothetical protein C0187_00735 [Calditerrivibrio nitroreducens]|uniref:Cytochrome c assembly protein domain-containing protein n=1 Tax=Calditerrivibrio nitroreducens TaxID=477976 RepID=A0A2J6WR72_9BACT|nr:MAG: hypothetical protein C0187_00735 [Calditerrivibrio nitroreducens]